MTLATWSALPLLLLASFQAPGANSKPPADPPPARAAVIRRAVAPERLLLANPAPVPSQRISVRIGSKLVQMESKPEPVAQDGEDAPPAAPMRIFNLQDMAFASENFDRLLFTDSRDEPARRARLHSLLDERIEVVGRTRELTEADRRTLRLAGTGDIEHFFGRVATAREDFEANRLDYTRGESCLTRLEPLAMEYAQGPFGAKSLFTKTLTRVTYDAWTLPSRLDSWMKPARNGGGMGLPPR